ncbi:MAG: hypothetical protein JWN14_3857, partial [Chthonomonadales bacterium]|nr:hypothetical protein [Chthonomonadales bacterium]
RGVRAKQLEVVKLLLARGADVHYRSRVGETALSLAQTKRKVVGEIRKLLEAAGAQPDLLEEECRQLIRIVEEAEELDPTIPERWQELWHAHLEGDNFNRAPIHHAQLLCRLGTDIAMFQDDYATAIGLLDRLPAHPNAHRLTKTNYCDLYEDKLYCLLMGGEESEAILLARQWMAGEAKAPQIEGWLIEQCAGRALEDYFEAQIEPQVVVLISTPAATRLHDFGTPHAAQVPVSQALTTLAWDISQRLRRRPLKRRKLPEQATPQELYALFQKRG